jgi:hypothetical protein
MPPSMLRLGHFVPSHSQSQDHDERSRSHHVGLLEPGLDAEDECEDVGI